METSAAPGALWLSVISRTKQAKSDLFSNTFYTTWMLISAKQGREDSERPTAMFWNSFSLIQIWIENDCDGKW